MKNENIELSIIIPAYNEENRLGKTLDDIITYLKAKSFRAEVIISDDGSADQTADIALAKLQPSGVPFTIIRAVSNAGKGNAVREGMLKAKGRYRLFTDADLSTPITELDSFLTHLQNGYDIVIGSRALQGSKIEIHQSGMREMMGRIFNYFARCLAFKGIHDSQCGFKCFSADAAKTLFEKQKLLGFSFDVEIVYLAQKLNFKLLEAPVVWNHSAQTRVQLFSDPFYMFMDLLKIKWIHRNEIKAV